MTQNTETVFTCDGCGDEQRDEHYVTAPHGWRKLAWNGGYVGDESREAHYCDRCAGPRLAALDLLLGMRK